MKTPSSCLYAGHVMHRRVRPRPHRLAYRVLSLLIDLDAADALSARLRLFSHNRFNLFAFHDRDHGDGTGHDLKGQVEAHMRDAGITPDGGPILLLCMPRMLGFTFNPLSIYFCHDRGGALVATLYEVSNTFGERHSYLMRAEVEGDAPVRQSAPKRFFVSPFLGMGFTYGFRLKPPGERYLLSITVSDERGAVLTAVHSAERRVISDGALARAFLSFPMVTLKVVAGIYWEAVKIWVKGMPLYRKPLPPADPVTVAPPQGPPRHVY
ncbi:DUF1365 domain-containing protein [Aquabacter cavernae]|uniref:DUF1365 domain-containing protein n=1 Tax=Aquabacter cavernae TaxID=2496029 RepID=UPI000F8C452F|nr:DUF1365 family protein [Aquabacter cavernae]